MSMFRKSAGTGGTRANNPQAGDASADLSTLLNYPSLARLFEGTDSQALEEMRARLARTNQDLERVVRQGSKEDAARAARAARAVGVTLALLEDLEKIRREGAPESGGAAK